MGLTAAGGSSVHAPLLEAPSMELIVKAERQQLQPQAGKQCQEKGLSTETFHDLSGIMEFITRAMLERML